ncbi:MAG: PqqD family protein [Alphaproteobacteria bacterium]
MRYGQRPGVSATEIDGDVFLVEPDTEEVFYLNVVAGGLWRALAEPMDLAELAALMRNAFPERAAAELDADVAATIEELARRRLVISVP